MARKRKPGPPRPDPEGLLEEFRAFGETLFKTKALPYLQRLLDTAQAKTKYPMYLETGMGATCLDCAVGAGGMWYTLEEAVACSDVRDSRVTAEVCRMRLKFPELIEFYQLALALADIVPGDVRPTVAPRAEDDTLDPADYVEKGPRVLCAGGCGVTGHADWDFVYKGGKSYCEACVNKR